MHCRLYLICVWFIICCNFVKRKIKSVVYNHRLCNLLFFFSDHLLKSKICDDLFNTEEMYQAHIRGSRVNIRQGKTLQLCLSKPLQRFQVFLLLRASVIMLSFKFEGGQRELYVY